LDSPNTISNNALCWFTSTVIAHEALHCLIVWWSEGTCNTPNIDGVVKEPRNYVERAWLGGLTIAEFPKDKVSSFNDMLSVGVEIKKDYYPIGIFGL